MAIINPTMKFTFQSEICNACIFNIHKSVSLRLLYSVHQLKALLPLSFEDSPIQILSKQIIPIYQTLLEI